MPASTYTHGPGLHVHVRANVLAYTFNGLPHVALRCTERKSARRSPGHQDRENFSPRLGQLREYQQTLRVLPVLSPVSRRWRCRDKTYTDLSLTGTTRGNAPSPLTTCSVCAWFVKPGFIHSRGYENFRCSVLAVTMPNMFCQ